MYRDDLEAAIARADAAERQLADAKEEIARLEAEVERLKNPPPPPKPARQPKPAKPPRPARTPSEYKPWILGVLGVVGFIGLTLALMYGGKSCARERVMTGPGKLESAHVMPAADGTPRLVLVSESMHRDDEHGSSPWRIDVVDPATGKRLLRKGAFESPRDHRPELASAGPGRMWCDLRGMYAGQALLVEQCDLETLAVVVTEAALVEKNPSLRGGINNSWHVDEAGGGLVATTTTGEQIFLDADDLTVRPSSVNQFQLPTLGRSQDGTNGSLPGDLKFSQLDSGSRYGLFREQWDTPRQQIGTQTWLAPELLAAADGVYAPMILPDGGVILLHQTTLDSNTANILISHLSLTDATTRWTVTLPPGQVKIGFRFDDVVLIAVSFWNDRASVVLALDWKTGAERWRYEL